MSLDVSLYIKVDTGGAEKKKIVLFDANITHNLADMADAAGIYKYLWRPEEIGAKCAGDIIEAVEKGLALMKSGLKDLRNIILLMGGVRMMVL